MLDTWVPRRSPAQPGQPSAAVEQRRDGRSSAHAATAPGDPWRGLVACLLALDALALAGAFGLAYAVRFKLGIPWLSTPEHSGTYYSSVALLAVPAWLGVFALHRLYDRRHLFAGSNEYVRVLQASTAGMMAMVMLSFVYDERLISRGWLLLTWVQAVAFVCMVRFGLRQVLRTVRQRGRLLVPTIVVGANEEGLALAEQLVGVPWAGPRLVGFVDPTRPSGTHVLGGLRTLGGLDQIVEVVRETGAREVVVATSALSRGELLDLYRAIGQDARVEVRLSSGLFEILTTGMQVHQVGNVPLLTPLRVRIAGVDAWLKGALDYLLAAVGVVALSPLLVVLALLVRLDSKGPAFHRRRVLGVSGKPFDAFKFRTMVENADEVLAQDAALRAEFESGYKLKRDPRITRVGQFLRKTSLDELPQLFNVLRGEMSIVGPRMIAPDEASRYGKWQLNLLTVKPGITGPWQVQGRSDLPYPERVRLSMAYIRNWSLWLDLEILLRTVWVVCKGRGAY